MLNENQISGIIFRLLKNEKHKSILESDSNVSVMDLINEMSPSKCYDLLFFKDNRKFFNKSEKILLAQKILLEDELSENIAGSRMYNMPYYLFKTFSIGMIEKYPEKIIKFVKNNQEYVEKDIDKFGFSSKEKERIVSILIANKLS